MGSYSLAEGKFIGFIYSVINSYYYYCSTIPSAFLQNKTVTTRVFQMAARGPNALNLYGPQNVLNAWQNKVYRA